MILDRLFNFIYQCSTYDLICWCTLAVLSFALLHCVCSKQCWWKPALFVGLIVWMLAVLYATILSRSPGVRYSISVIPFHSYMEVLRSGNHEILRSNFMNGYLFFPAGVLGIGLLPGKWSIRKRFALMIGVGSCVSLSIETLQYILSMGHFEVDDILHNTVGMIFGCAFCEAALDNISRVTN